MGTTRLYLRNVAPAISPTPDSGWDDTGGLVRGQLGLVGAGASTGITRAETSTSGTFDVGLGQWISDPVLRPGSLAGTASIVAAVSESDAAANLVGRFRIAVLSGDGTVVRSSQSFINATEWPTATAGYAFGTATLVAIDVQVGDRIVVEAGYRATNTSSTSYSGTLTHGTSGSTGPYVDFTDPLVADLFTDPGVDFLPHELASARLAVEVAWGADLAAAPDTWTWTDVTADVRHADRIKITIGRSDEAAVPQPATCRLVLDNTDGDYSYGGQSANWPNVRRNTPVRVRVTPSAADPWTVRFLGYAVGFTPEWDPTGRDATVTLEAAGVTRRLAQGNAPVLSTLRRYVLARHADGAGIRAYWPCEDPKGSTSIASGLPGGEPMSITADAEFPYPKWAASADDFLCSAPLPEVNGTTWRGVVPAHTETGQIQVRMLIGIPDDGSTGIEAPLFSVYTTGTIARWDVSYQPGGSLDLEAYDTSGTLVASQNVAINADGTRRRLSLTLAQDGADVDYSLSMVPVELFSGGGGQMTGTITTDTIGRATAIAVNPGGLVTDTVIGHITVEDTNGSFYSDQAAFNGRLGENSGTRLERLCDEAGIDVETISTATGSMAAQPPAQILALIRQCDTVDGGVIHDGLSAGLRFVTYSARAAEPAQLTLTVGDLAKALEPVSDDQGVRNKITVKSLRGGEYTAEDTDGPLGTDTIGIYDTTVEASAFYSTVAENLAGHRLALGTVDGYRHPRLTLNLARNPDLADDWLAVTLASRIDVTGINAVRTQHPAGDVDLIVEGWTETLDQLRWDVVANCSPYDPWRVGLVSADTGDTGEFVARAADNDTSTLAASASAGATSLSVATTAGDPLWTTVADDYPLDVEVGGITVTVTACSGTSSPQTFTVTGSTVTKALASGLAVTVARPNLVATTATA